MSDAVRQRMEQRVKELHDLMDLGIFSQEEIRVIIKKREDFEYALRRRQTRLQDYEAYIAYEKNLESLRKHRKKELHIQSRKHLSDSSIIQHIHLLYFNGLKKFKDNLDLWFSYFEFCKKYHAFKRLSRSYAECLQLHPHVAKVWIAAARWEWEHNNSVETARRLFQRGLRVNKTEKELWLDYFRLEIEYWEKQKKRAEVLGINIKEQDEEVAASMKERKRKMLIRKKKGREPINSDDDESDDDDEQGSNDDDENKEKGMATRSSRTRKGNRGGDDDELDSDSDDDEFDADKELKEAKSIMRSLRRNEEQDEDLDAEEVLVDEDELSLIDDEDTSAVALAKRIGVSFWSLFVPRLVYFSAIENFPGDLSVCEDFLAIYRCFDGTEACREQIYSLLPMDDAKALDVLCRRPVDDHPQGQSFDEKEKFTAAVVAHKLYQEAVSQTELRALKGHHVSFLKQVADYFSGDADLGEAARALFENQCEAYLSAEEPPTTAILFHAQTKGNPAEIIETLESFLKRDASYATELSLWKALLDVRLGMYMQARQAPSESAEGQRTSKSSKRKSSASSAVVDSGEEGDTCNALYKTFVDAANHLQYKDSEAVLKAAWEFFTRVGQLKKAQAVVKLSVEKRQKIARSLVCAHVEHLKSSASATRLRKFTHWVQEQGQIAQSVDFWCLYAASEEERSTKAQQIRDIYTSAVATYGKQSAKLWATFIAFEERLGDSKTLRNVRYLASRSLENPSSLEQYMLQAKADASSE